MVEEIVMCSRLTKKKKKCPNVGDRVDKTGAPVCHLHNPQGKFRQNVERFRSEHQARQRRSADG